MFGLFRSNTNKKPTDTTTVQQTLQETFIQEQRDFHSMQSLAQIYDYQRERQEKLDLINERVVSNGYDMEEFLKILSKEKENGQNVDFHAIDEIIKVIEREQTVHSEFSSKSTIDLEEKRGLRSGTLSANYNINRDVASSTITRKVHMKRMTQKIQGTIFNQNKNIVCSVTIPFVTQPMETYPISSLQFEVATHPFKWKVRRTPQEFLQLREYLLKMYPQTLVPSLPYLNPKKSKLTQRQLKKKCIYYQRFLTCIMTSQVLRSAEFLVDFLREGDVEQFSRKVVAAKIGKGPERIDQINTLYGDVEVNAGKRAKKFCRRMGKYIETQSDITSFIKKKCVDLQKKSHDLANEFFGVATEIQRFSTLLKATEIPQITQLYDKVSQLILKNGDFILQSGEILNTQLSTWFKYHYDETQAFKDQKELVDSAKRRYEAKLKDLTDKKNQLFRKGDVKLWKVDDESIQEAMLVKSDKGEAFKYMLPKETAEVQQKKEEWEFFTNQCYKEIKRVTSVNYDMGREVLVNVGEMMSRIIYTLNMSWQEFLSYYTGINTDRKQYDEKFFEERGILEEADDCVESSEDEDDLGDFVDEDIPGVLVPDDQLYKEKKEDWRIGSANEWL